MTEPLQVEMSPRQKELILRGLRYVYSSIALDTYDPTPETRVERETQLNEIKELTVLVGGNESIY